MFKYIKSVLKKKSEAVTESTECMVPLYKVVEILERVQRSLTEESFIATDCESDTVEVVERCEIEDQLVNVVDKVREEYGLNV